MNDDIGDYDAATSRSSAKRISSVICKFDAAKRKLVTDIGFGGMLHMPQNNKVCRRFSVWLLRHIDVSRKSIVINPNTVITITDSKMHRVLGIPCGEMKVVGLGKDIQEKIDFIKFAIGSIGTDPSETSSLKVAEEILLKDYGQTICHEDSERFKVSFVVFVTGHFLIAKSRINHGADDYWGALLDTKQICKYNFCSLVIDEIMESATRVQSELKANKNVKNISGCSLGLQVLYVDSFNLGILHYASPAIPRIALFDCETMNRMVKAIQAKHRSSCYAEPCSGRDMSNNRASSDVKNERGFVGKTHSVCTSEESSNSMLKVSRSNVTPDCHRTVQMSLTKPAVSAYLTAYLRADQDNKLTNRQIDDLKWHNARMTLHVRNTKSLLTDCNELCDPKGTLKSIVEVHMEALMARIFQDNLRLAQRLHVHQQDIVNSTNTLQTDSGSTTRISSAANLERTIDCNVSKKCVVSTGAGSNASSSTTGAPKNIKLIEGKRLFDDDVFSTIKRVKHEPVEIISYNKTEVEGMVDRDFLDTNVKKIVCKQGSMAKSPWIFGVIPAAQAEEHMQALHDWLLNNNSSTLQSYWIIHSNPRYIDLTGLDLKEIFIKCSPFSRDAFDIVVRRFNQMDQTMYGYGEKKCWRKTLESDFASVVLADEDPLLSVSVIEQFTGASQIYDISECRMLIVPALLDNTWCSYFWDMKEKVVHVVDAHAYDSAPSVLDDFHILIIAKLQTALTKCIDTLFEGWSVDWKMFRRKYIKLSVPPPGSVSEGITTMVAMRDFDGEKIMHDHNDVSLKIFEKMLMYEMISIEGNYGKVPEAYIQAIDG